MIIQILGIGCTKCKKLEENVREVITLLSGDITIEKVTDLDQIMDFGVMITPALVIDDEVKSVGKVLSPDEIRNIIIK